MGKSIRKECDMRGMLSFYILWLLRKKSMHGQEIAFEIGKRKGEMPKAGTIYPALKHLKKNRLLKGRKSGKEITYSLTPSGRNALKRATDYFCRVFGEIIRNNFT